MLHHQRRANRVDGKDMLQVSGVQVVEAALRLALLAVQEAGGDDQQAQVQPGGRTLSRYPLRRSDKAGLIKVVNADFCVSTEAKRLCVTRFALQLRQQGCANAAPRTHDYGEARSAVCAVCHAAESGRRDFKSLNGCEASLSEPHRCGFASRHPPPEKPARPQETSEWWWKSWDRLSGFPPGGHDARPAAQHHQRPGGTTLSRLPTALPCQKTTSSTRVHRRGQSRLLAYLLISRSLANLMEMMRRFAPRGVQTTTTQLASSRPKVM